jgi:hypothetical protein
MGDLIKLVPKFEATALTEVAGHSNPIYTRVWESADGALTRKIYETADPDPADFASVLNDGDWLIDTTTPLTIYIKDAAAAEDFRVVTTTVYSS